MTFFHFYSTSTLYLQQFCIIYLICVICVEIKKHLRTFFNYVLFHTLSSGITSVFNLKKNYEGLRTFVITTKDNHLPYTAVPFMIITYHIFSNYIFRQNSAYAVFDDLLSPVVSRRTFNIQRHYWRTVFNNDVVFLLWTSLKQRALPVVVRWSDVDSLNCTRLII